MGEYVLIEDGVVRRHIAAPKKPGKGWVRVPNNWAGSVGDKADFYDWGNKGIAKPIDRLVAEGLIVDARGVYYDTKTGQQKVIDKVGVVPDADWTTTPPIASVPLAVQVFDGKKWVVDEAKERQHELEQLQAKKQGLIEAIIEKQALNEPTDEFMADLQAVLTGIKKLSI